MNPEVTKKIKFIMFKNETNDLEMADDYFHIIPTNSMNLLRNRKKFWRDFLIIVTVRHKIDLARPTDNLSLIVIEEKSLMKL